ncbi:group 1 glycosyl transferase [Salinisphaera sp. S4-8]|uniref:glycosyltransferase family 4 protein n=1 Tax=Salinisphaera sp. S4-8 TaxID=633357 RepID=UPI0033422D36
MGDSVESNGRAAPAALIYRLNLNVVGGAEVSFAQYADYRRGAAHADTVIVHGEIHPRFTPVVAPPMRTVARRTLARWHGIRLPRAARHLRARTATAQLVRGNETALVGWNSIGNRDIADIAEQAALPLIHYEHGQAWREQRRHARGYMARAKGVISNSLAAERMLALRWGWQGPTERVYCAIDGILDVDAARTALPQQRPIWLGSAGRLIELKGHLIALHVLKVLRDVHGIDARLAIAGTGEREAALREAAHTLGLSRFVRFEGGVNDMRAFYDAIDIMLVASMREPFGRTSIEAQARGCPVVATWVDGLPETLAATQHAQSLVAPEWSLAEYARELDGQAELGVPWVYDPRQDELVAPRAPTPDRLAAAVMTLLGSDAAYHRVSRAGLAHVGQRFSVVDYGPALDRAIMRLATGPA